MSRVGLVAAGQVPFTMERGRIDEMMLAAAQTILRDADKSCIDGILVSTNDSGRYLGAILSQTCGIRPRMAHTVESMCSSGGSALLAAYSYIKSGLARAVLVVGAELPDSPGGVLRWDMSRGQFQSPLYWGSILTKAYKRRYQVPAESVSAVAAKNRSMAASNPEALCGRRCTISDVMASKSVTSELRLLDCSRACGGAAAILVAEQGVCDSFTDNPVWIDGISQSTVGAGFGSYHAHHKIESVRKAADDAYRMAGIAPDMVDVAEVHDAFSVCEIMAVEGLGLAGYGQGAGYARDLYTTTDRRINPRGGILGSGHPLGATGISQVVEVFRQLRGEAAGRQVGGARSGLAQVMSAAGTSSVVTVMRA